MDTKELRLDEFNIPEDLKGQLQELLDEDPNKFKKVKNHIAIFFKTSLKWNKEKIQAELDNIREDDLVRKDVFKRVKRAVLQQKLKDGIEEKNVLKPKSDSPPPKKSRKSISIVNQAKSTRRKSVAPQTNSNKRKRSPTPSTTEESTYSNTINRVALSRGDKNEISQYVIYSQEFIDSSTAIEIVHHSSNASILAVTRFHQLHSAQEYVNSRMLRSSFAVPDSNALLALRNTLYRKDVSHITYEKSAENPKIDIVVTAPTNTEYLNKTLKDTMLYLPKFTSGD